ncbi:MAG: YcgN family cysteine cluster protein [bacterium]|nr:YcgN family cysteine cluster protein [bacterium]
MKDTSEQPFWKKKPLSGMTREEWESLCDGCAKCCLFKFENQEQKEVEYTNVSCRLLDTATCTCTSYWNRSSRVPSCMTLTPKRVEDFYWLPKSCAYRLIEEGKDLPSWHHLVCGDKEMIHTMGFSVKSKVIPEEYVHPDDLPLHIMEWG